MNKYEAEKVILKNRENEPFVLVQNVEGDEIDDLSMLDWQADTDPPDWEEVQGWYNTWKTEYDAEVASEEAKATDLTTTRTDLVTQYQAATTRLNAIITNGPTYTAAQTRDAVVDMAKVQLQILKLIKLALT
jgi:hypothetical protein